MLLWYVFLFLVTIQLLKKINFTNNLREHIGKKNNKWYNVLDVKEIDYELFANLEWKTVTSCYK